MSSDRRASDPRLFSGGSNAIPLNRGDTRTPQRKLLLLLLKFAKLVTSKDHRGWVWSTFYLAVENDTKPNFLPPRSKNETIGRPCVSGSVRWGMATPLPSPATRQLGSRTSTYPFLPWDSDQSAHDITSMKSHEQEKCHDSSKPHNKAISGRDGVWVQSATSTVSLQTSLPCPYSP